jgi:DNA-binding beta-propeller fold protein YncE
MIPFHSSPRQRRSGGSRLAFSVMLFIAATVSAAILLSNDSFDLQQLTHSAQSAARRNGSARLVATESLAPMDEMQSGAQCEWEPAGVEMSATLARQQRAAMTAVAADDDPHPGNTVDFSQRKPIRMIKDNYAGFSAVAVDHKNDEVILSDENLFQILVYDRKANTPPQATMTEPKRILGGDKTEIEFQCGLYVDPRTGDIYGVNNDTVDQMVIFTRNQKGDTPPDRMLHTPHGTFGIAVDEDRNEMYLTIQHDHAVVVYDKNATGETNPKRLIQGNKTLLGDPHGIAIDPQARLMFVTNYGSTSTKVPGRGERRENWPLEDVVPGSGHNMPPSITVYPMDAQGDIAPVRIIQGPKTKLNWGTGISIDHQRGEIFVANDMTSEVLVYDLNANGDVAPKRVLAGPKTMIQSPTAVYVDQANNELWVTNFGNHTATVYRRDAGGDTPPLRVIRSAPLNSPAPMMGNPHPVAYDTKRDQILVPN